MRKVKTVQEVIARLRNDCRQDWWEEIDALIKRKAYKKALHRLNDHSNDIDYDEQCAVIGAAIAADWSSSSQ